MIPNMMMVSFRLETEADIEFYRKHLESNEFPIMGIDQWGEGLGVLPNGFVKCDGQNGTPDLMIKNLDMYYIMKLE